jgi:hypothetical protein
MTHAFLSPEWIDAAEEIYERHRAEREGRGQLPGVVLNLVVEDAPFAEGEVAAHLDTTTGLLQILRGRADKADLTLRTGYETARSLLIDQNPQAAFEGFLFGRILIEGDMAALASRADIDVAKLPAMFGGVETLAEVDPVAARIAEELRDLTA